jgi:hypothetical protein
VIHARAAANAAQRRTHLAREHVGAPAVDDDEVHVLRAVKLALAFRSREDVDVVRDRLPVAERGSRRISVATSSRVGTIFSMPEIAMCTFGSVVASVALPSFVTSTTGPRLGDEEVAARDPHVRREVVLPQHTPRFAAQLLDARLDRRAVRLVEELRPPPPSTCAAPGR